MRQLNGCYTQASNRRHERVGHPFHGRVTAILVEEEAHMLELCRYVVLNPVRAKEVPHPPVTEMYHVSGELVYLIARLHTNFTWIRHSVGIAELDSRGAPQ